MMRRVDGSSAVSARFPFPGSLSRPTSPNQCGQSPGRLSMDQVKSEPTELRVFTARDAAVFTT